MILEIFHYTRLNRQLNTLKQGEGKLHNAMLSQGQSHPSNLYCAKPSMILQPIGGQHITPSCSARCTIFPSECNTSWCGIVVLQDVTLHEVW